MSCFFKRNTMAASGPVTCAPIKPASTRASAGSSGIWKVNEVPEPVSYARARGRSLGGIPVADHQLTLLLPLVEIRRLKTQMLMGSAYDLTGEIIWVWTWQNGGHRPGQSGQSWIGYPLSRGNHGLGDVRHSEPSRSQKLGCL